MPARRKRVWDMPSLATVVPSVVSCTDRPIPRPSVKMELTRGRPNSVVLQYSASMWMAAEFIVAVVNVTLSDAVTVRRISRSNTCSIRKFSNQRPAMTLSLSHGVAMYGTYVYYKCKLGCPK